MTEIGQTPATEEVDLQPVVAPSWTSAVIGSFEVHAD